MDKTALDFRWLAGSSIVLCAIAPGYATTYMSVEQAQAALFPRASFVSMPLTLTADQISAVEAKTKVPVKLGQLNVWRTTTGGFLFVDKVIGKHDLITFALAIEETGHIKGIEILDYREAYGYEIRGAKWREQFVGKTKDAALTVGDDIKNISGATLSTRHVTNAVRNLIAIYALVLSH